MGCMTNTRSSSKSPSVARQTAEYIAKNPSIKECLRRGLVNHTALAREICSEYRIDKIDAVVMASTRYAARIQKQRSHENDLRQMLSRAKILVSTKVLLATWDRSVSLNSLLTLHNHVIKKGGELTIVEGHRLITVFTEHEFADEIRRLVGRNIKMMLKDLVKITLLLPEKVIFTHGYAAYMFKLIADQGINMVGDVTSTAEHIFVINEKDLDLALSALKVS